MSTLAARAFAARWSLLLVSTAMAAAACASDTGDGDDMTTTPTGGQPSTTAPGPTTTAPGPTTTAPGPTTTAPGPTDTTAPPPAPTGPEAIAPIGSPAPTGFTVCGVCHGSGAQGVASLGPELRHPVADSFTWVVRNGRTGHPDYPGAMAPYDETLMPDTDLQEIITWLGSAPKPTTGQGLFADYCAFCHAEDGSGGASGRELRTHTGEFLSNVRNGSHPGDFGNRTEYMPSWTADQLSDAEVQLIADYIASL